MNKSDEEQRLKLTRSVRDQIEQRLRLWLMTQGITPNFHRQI